MQAKTYNDLQQFYRQGITKDDPVFIEETDSGVALVNTGIFTTEKMIAEHPDAVQGVVTATMRGWKEALANPDEAAAIVVKYNSEMKADEQVAQIKAMGELFCSGVTKEGKFGMSVKSEWETAQKVLLGAKLIDNGIELEKGFTNAFWEKVPEEYKQIACP